MIARCSVGVREGVARGPSDIRRGIRGGGLAGYQTKLGRTTHGTQASGHENFLPSPSTSTSPYKTKKVNVPKEASGREDVPDTATA